MEKKIIAPSELIINSDGSVFHLHLLPEQLTDRIILVGDPARVNIVAEHFDTRTFEVSSREFHTIGGTYKGKPIMCLSHGIGPDNIDIVINELDALANIDFATREVKDNHRTLTMVRIGTSGALQPELIVGTPVVAEKAIGFDGVLNYYAGRNEVADLEFEKAFCDHTGWNPLWAKPYVVDADSELVDMIARDDMVRGNTISAVGFYGPQGRELRLPLANPDLNRRIPTAGAVETHGSQGYDRMLHHSQPHASRCDSQLQDRRARPHHHRARPHLISPITISQPI